MKRGTWGDQKDIAAWCCATNCNVMVYELNSSYSGLDCVYNHSQNPRPALLFSEKGQAFDLSFNPCCRLLRTNNNHYDYITSDGSKAEQARGWDLSFDYLDKATFVLSAMELNEPLPKGHELILAKVATRSAVRRSNSPGSMFYFIYFFFSFFCNLDQFDMQIWD